MRVALLAVEEAAQAERAGQRPADRLVEQQVARLARAELAVGVGLYRQFALDARQVGGVGRDLLLVLQGDALFLVVAAADAEGQAAAVVHFELFAACLDRQRHADHGDPAPAILPDHQHRLALVASDGTPGRLAQIDHGHSAGHRLVEQAAEESFGQRR
ncbi:hypothetical protein D3C85_1057980 [compost metagenome]